MVVPTIIGKTPVVLMSKKSFLGMVETKRHEKPLQPLTMMFIRIVARMPRINSVASPVRPVKKNDAEIEFLRAEMRSGVSPVFGRYWPA